LQQALGRNRLPELNHKTVRIKAVRCQHPLEKASSNLDRRAREAYASTGEAIVKGVQILDG
jgi:hypothetical protein